MRSPQTFWESNRWLPLRLRRGWFAIGRHFQGRRQTKVSSDIQAALDQMGEGNVLDLIRATGWGSGRTHLALLDLERHGLVSRRKEADRDVWSLADHGA